MKQYTITVNGVAYDVTVEENTNGSAVPQQTAPRAAAPAPKAPIAPAKPATSVRTGSIQVNAGAAGSVFKIPTTVGQAVKKGDPVVIIEAMKMEIGVPAPQDGTVASIDCQVGDAIEAGQLLATLN